MQERHRQVVAASTGNTNERPERAAPVAILIMFSTCDVLRTPKLRHCFDYVPEAPAHGVLALLEETVAGGGGGGVPALTLHRVRIIQWARN